MTKNPFDLDAHLHLRKKLSTVSRSSLVDIYRAASGGRKISALIRFFKARFGPGKLSSGEYLQFGLHKSGVSDEHMAAYAGKRAQEAFNKIYNDKTWYAITKHKMLFETVMRGAKLPSPETVAIYDSKGRGAGAILLKTRDELKDFISNSKNLPVFCKPTTGLLSIGSFRVDAIKGDALIINGRHEKTIDETCDYMIGLSKKGYLFQKVLIPHKRLEKLNGKSIASVRFVVLNNEKKAQIHSCILKLPAPGEVADNFWRQGAILCSISVDKHKIERAIINQGRGYKLIENNPETGETIVGFKMPDFNKAINLTLKAARYLQGIRMQSWDVGFTSSGPVLLEVNYGGDMNLPQLATGKGVMNKAYCDTLRAADFRGKLPN